MFLWGAAPSEVLAVGISLVSILWVGDWARVSALAGHYFPPISQLQVGTQDSMQYALLGLSKCQALTYMKSCECWGVWL